MVLPFIASKAAGKASSEAIKPTQADLLVLRGKTRPKRKGEVPIDWEFHLNPLGIGLLAVGGAATLWLLQLKACPLIVETRFGYYSWPDGTRVDKEDVALYSPKPKQECYYPPVGHYTQATKVVGYHEVTIPGSWVKGSWKPAQTVQMPNVTVDPDAPDVWVEDVAGYYVTVEATWNDTETRKVKQFSIEQRQPFLGSGSPWDLANTGKAPTAKGLLTDPWGIFPW